MYTRCPACQAVYELQARLLASAAGVVRCGNCGKTFNSLAELFDHHPDHSAEPLRGSGMPPLLEHPDMVQGELPVDAFDALHPPADMPAADEPLAEFQAGSGRWIWPTVSAVLLIVLLGQLWMLWQLPGSPLAGWFGGAGRLDPGVDPNAVIEIVSRDLHAHPSLDDAVILSASLRSRADRPVPFPIIEVRFLDASQQVLGARRLVPSQYLRDPDAIERGLQPGVVVPLLLEFVVDGGQPAGFQMRFHPYGSG